MSSKHVYDCKHEWYTEEQRTFLQNLLRQKLWKHASGLHVSDCQNFPGLGTRQTDTQTDTQPIPRNWLLDPRVHQSIPIQSLVKQMKWYGNFMHKQRHGLVRHCALLIYNINGYLLYRRVQDVLHQPNHYEKILFPTILKDAHLFCKETTNQPQPQGLNPNQQAKVTAWHTKPCKPIQRTPKTDTFLE